VQLNNFRKALKFVLDHEGGYVNDKDDPGGETKWGIAKRYHPELDIKMLLPEQAARIYADEYWVPSGCDGIAHPYSTVVFDTAVNCGVSRAVMWLKQAEDIPHYIHARKNFYFDQINSNPVKVKYLKGWVNRLTDLAKYCQIEIEKAPV